MKPGAKLETTATAALLTLVACGFVYFCHWLSWPVVDDAGISFVYGRTLFEGSGFRATPNSQVVEAFSSPLWTMLLGLSVPLHAAPEAFAWWSGVLLGAGALFVLGLWGPASEGRPLRLEDAVAPLLTAAFPTFSAWVSSGMETGLFAFTGALAGALALRGMRLEKGAGAGWALGALVLARPEAPLYVGATAAVWGLWSAFAWRIPWRAAGRVLLGLAVVAGGWAALRWWLFADVVPNTYWAKRLWDFNPTGYVESFRAANSWTFGAAALGGLISLLLGSTRARAFLALGFATAAVLFALEAKGDWMGEWRFLAPAAPFLGAAVAAGLSSARGRMGKPWPTRAIAALAGVMLLLATGAAFDQAFARRAAVKGNPQFAFSAVQSRSRGVGETLKGLGQRRPLIGFPDLGGLADALRDAEILDVGGLGDKAIALHTGNLTAMDDYLESEGPPVLVDCHGPSGYLSGLKRLMAWMEPAGGSTYKLKGLTADEDPRCPDGKAAVLAAPPEALLEALATDITASEPQRAIRRWRCAFAYQPDERLPRAAELRRLADVAMDRSHVEEALGALEPALRYASLATLLSAQDAHLRRRTESLRARFLPNPKKP